MFTVLSNYLLDDAGNRRIADAVAACNGRFIPAPRERADRVALVDRHIAEADVLLGGTLTPEQWAQAKRLRWIHVPWAGVNNLMALPGMSAANIAITNSSGVMSDSVADQVMAYLLLIARDMVPQIRAQPESRWLQYTLENTPRRTLRGHTLGIVGYGAIGRAVGERARAFGMRVVAMRGSNGPVPEGIAMMYPPAELHAMLAASHMVVIAAPLNDTTRGMFNAAAFAAMRNNAWLINIARGAIVDTEALVEALRAGSIGGAALDVFQQEPLPPDSPLWLLPNTIVTPHTSGGHQGFWEAVVDLFLENLGRYRSGLPMLNTVDPARGY